MEGQKDKIHPTGSQEGEKWPKMTKKCSLFLEQRTNEGDMSNGQASSCLKFVEQILFQ